MPVNWKAEDAYTRLLAAIVAANDLKVRQKSTLTSDDDIRSLANSHQLSVFLVLYLL